MKTTRLSVKKGYFFFLGDLEKMIFEPQNISALLFRNPWISDLQENMLYLYFFFEYLSILQFLFIVRCIFINYRKLIIIKNRINILVFPSLYIESQGHRLFFNLIIEDQKPVCITPYTYKIELGRSVVAVIRRQITLIITLVVLPLYFIYQQEGLHVLLHS